MKPTSEQFLEIALTEYVARFGLTEAARRALLACAKSVEIGSACPIESQDPNETVDEAKNIVLPNMTA